MVAGSTDNTAFGTKMKPDTYTLAENAPGFESKVVLVRNDETQTCPYEKGRTCGSSCPMFIIEWDTVKRAIGDLDGSIIGQIKSIPIKVHIGCASISINLSNE